MKIRFLKTALSLLVLFGLMVPPLAAQAPVIKRAYLGQPMSDFELPALDGKTVKLSALKGRNVLLVFPRVFYAVDEYCSLCGYQYAELADRYQADNWKKKFNLEVLYVLPFPAEVIRAWLARIPKMLEEVESWKNPKAEDLKNEGIRRWTEIVRQAYPRKYSFSAAAIPMPFPILVDEKR
jgi:hypothetical protein